jgi:hypothetical protein
MGQREEDGVGLVGDRVEDPEVARREMRVDARDGVAPALPADQPGDPDMRVEGEEPDELRADIARRPDDRDADRVPEMRPGPDVGSRAGSGGTAGVSGDVVMTVRRDRRLGQVRAHGRAGPLAGGRLVGSEIGRSVVTV